MSGRHYADEPQELHVVSREYYIGGRRVSRDEFAESQHAYAARHPTALATHWAANQFYN